MYISLLRNARGAALRVTFTMNSRQSSDVAKFKESLKKAKNVVILSGAGISAESGIPTFRGSGGYWRKYPASRLASPEAFNNNPSLVWEFYHYRREVAAAAKPNSAHVAIADYESRHGKEKSITVITQNIDNLHARAGTQNLIELHGNLYKTRCLICGDVAHNTDSPICEALAGRGAPDVDIVGSDIPNEALPHCKRANCGGLLRPHIVWFGENLDSEAMEKTSDIISECDVCLVVGTSSTVYPAAMYAPQAAQRGAVVAEFNIECNPSTQYYQYFFEGPCGQSLPTVLCD